MTIICSIPPDVWQAGPGMSRCRRNRRPAACPDQPPWSCLSRIALETLCSNQTAEDEFQEGQTPKTGA